jgi:hypothetical protein
MRAERLSVEGKGRRSSIGREKSIPETLTPRFASGMAIRPVPTPNSSAALPLAR